MINCISDIIYKLFNFDDKIIEVSLSNVNKLEISSKKPFSDNKNYLASKYHRIKADSREFTGFKEFKGSKKLI